MTVYKESELVGKILHALKYDVAEDIERAIEVLVARYLTDVSLFCDVDVVIPVPLHPKRYAERGFNQAASIARIVTERLDVPLEKGLRRSKHTRIQARLSKTERIENVKEAFVCADNSLVQGKKILLVDDVFTTGSTMQECARILLAAGADEVKGFSIARG